MFALTLFPTLMFALGCIQVAESLGGSAGGGDIVPTDFTAFTGNSGRQRTGVRQ